MSMKKTVLKFGLLSAALSSAMMLATVPFIHRLGFEKGAIFGYTAIVLSFLLVFLVSDPTGSPTVVACLLDAASSSVSLSR